MNYDQYSNRVWQIERDGGYEGAKRWMHSSEQEHPSEYQLRDKDQLCHQELRRLRQHQDKQMHH